MRGVKTLNFAGTEETVYERSDWPLPKLQDYFKNDTLAIIGYGSQGHGQGLNLRDNGLNVIIGVRKDGKSWKDAIQDGWVPGKNLFEVDEAITRGTVVMNLLSDAAQSETWPAIKPQLTKGKVSSAIPLPACPKQTADRLPRPSTSPTVSPLFTKTTPRSSPLPMSMSSSLLPKVQDVPSEPCSRRVVESTLPLLCGKM